MHKSAKQSGIIVFQDISSLSSNIPCHLFSSSERCSSLETSSRQLRPRVNFATEGCLNCLTRQDGLIVWASREIYSRLRAPCLVDDPRQGNRVINTPPKRVTDPTWCYAFRSGKRSSGMRKADNSSAHCA